MWLFLVPLQPEAFFLLCGGDQDCAVSWRNQIKPSFFCVFPFLKCVHLEMCWISLSGLPGPTWMSLVEGADAITIKSWCRCLKHCPGLLDSSLVPTEGTVHLCLTLRLRWRRVCVLAEADSCSFLLRQFQQMCRAGSGSSACCRIYQHSSVSSETILKAFSFG